MGSGEYRVGVGINCFRHSARKPRLILRKGGGSEGVTRKEDRKKKQYPMKKEETNA
jgi:hypothetical protein